ncbi:MAG: primosomal protein N' [Candidatus Krumholzibacteriia bacterium]
MNQTIATSWLVDVALPVPLAEHFTYRWPPAGAPLDEPAVGPADPPEADPPEAGAPGATARSPETEGADGRLDAGAAPGAGTVSRAPRVGDLVGVPFGRRREVIGLVVAVHPDARERSEVAGRALRRVRRLLPPEYGLGPGRLELARWLAEYYALPLGEVVPLFHPPAPATRFRAGRRQEAVYPDVDPATIVLTDEQQAAVAQVGARIESGQYGVTLLHGVTGSGKTEVFLAAMAAALDRGRSAIYLLPEIALTPQTLGRIHARFGDRAAALHSSLSAGERCRVHEAAARGEVRVVVGPRSALFAPVRDLGLVVVDEEHETSFKQEEKPRYHARHAALVRARAANAPVVLGSATPELESFHNARTGRYDLLVLRRRMGADLPPVDLVDMRGAVHEDGFSEELTAAVEHALSADRQVLLYYNRRGFARALQCGACGDAPTCPRCDIALTYHLRPRRLLCHYCGHARAVPGACPACAAEDTFLASGGGTEKLELALQGLFPGVKVLRLDQDTTRRRGSHGRILAEFAGGGAGILVGTQMVAKGHHFPGVELVGVLAADDGLTLPDYRAAERSFQLLTQVAGRAGRTAPGRVLFQTYRPDDPVILAAAAHDFDTFAAVEMAARRQLLYPPFTRLVRLAVSARRQGDAEAAAAELAGAVRRPLEEAGAHVLGPAPAVFARLQDRHRFQVLVKGRLTIRQKAWLAATARHLEAVRRGVRAFVDVDPLTIY